MVSQQSIWSLLSCLLVLGGLLLILKSRSICREVVVLSEKEDRHKWNLLNRAMVGFIVLYSIAAIGCWGNFQPWIIMIFAIILSAGSVFVYFILTLSRNSLSTLKQTHHSKAFLTEIFQTMGNALIVADAQGEITLVNNCLSKLLQIDADELIGKNAEELFIEEISDMPGIQHENKMILKNLKELPVLVTISHTIQSGESIRIIVIQDVRKQKENELRLKEYLKKIEQSNRELEQFSYVAAHDLKAPLRAIQNLTEFIEEDMQQMPDGVKGHFQLIKGRIARMENLINGLLEYAKTGKKGMELELTDVEQLLGEITENLGVASKAKVEIQENMPVIVTHKLLLEQVFANLISNAHKYNSHPEPIIRITSKELGHKLEFSVSDNGPGIPEESQDKIFRIFQTLQPRDTYESTGIGLSIVKKIIEETGCEICVDSELGNGSTFRFTWPRSGAA